ncbi:MAG: glycoside hydrolase family 19 protein [Rudaea sp.]|uniref:glycoside hydrolase family 19 protein n=1 Tax=unclassified Rudaea TaxID=2627037 RepID=UPI0010F8E0F2|nr:MULTISPECIES: glycoside hydrolase family 19 protein [unclassified Rudaea]MBN8888530.1 glycoside hydrolase family 19 protein [Rudaea sp.]MBR0343926.1 glycoside hydrolase family 19 protein [Rudaea sp.]
MSIQPTSDQIDRLAPSARSSYRAAFLAGQEAFDRFRISDNALRIAHFMAQVLHECEALTVQFENLNYSAQRLPVVWPSRFQPQGPLDPMDYANAPEKLANEVYGGRMGNLQEGDGYLFRGRGLLQMTGRDEYAKVTGILRDIYPESPDFTESPDVAIDAVWCLRAAGAVWQWKGCNELADQDSIRAVTRAINGGLIGLADRMEWLRRTKSTWQ